MARASNKPPPPPEQAQDRPYSLPSAEMQQLWFSCFKHPWTSLVVVPSQPGASSALVARSLAEIGGLHRGSAIKLINAEGMEIRGSSELIVQMTGQSGGAPIIVAIDSVISNQAGIPVALAADAVLLVVPLGEAELENARRTIELIGEKKFIGSVTVERR